MCDKYHAIRKFASINFFVDANINISYMVGMPKLTKKNKNFYSIIGKMGGKARKDSGVDYSALAALSHKTRTEYNGGRPKGSKNKKKGQV